MAAGERLTRPLGLTAARWQVLSAVARAEQPETVAGIGRLMGLSRQAVQRVANEMTSEGLLESILNPSHRRSPLLRPTREGRALFERMTERQVAWANTLAQGLSEGDIEQAIAVIAAIMPRFALEVDALPARDAGRAAPHGATEGA
jgi:DNA-binding MarR family transcriptional regulator